MMGRFGQPDEQNEFVGCCAWSGKRRALLGPLSLGVLTQWSGSQRVGVSVVLILFALGLVLLATVDEEEGLRVSGFRRPTD